MKTSQHSFLLAVLVLGLAVTSVSAQLSVTDMDRDYVIDFESTLEGVNNGVPHFVPGKDGTVHSEFPKEGALNKQGIMMSGFARSQGGNPGTWSDDGPDLFSDSYRRGQIGTPTTQPFGFYVSAAGSRGADSGVALVMKSQMRAGATSASDNFTDEGRAFSLVIENNTGATVSNWTLSVDVDVYKIVPSHDNKVLFTYDAVSDPAEFDTRHWIGNLSNVEEDMMIDTSGFTAKSWVAANRSVKLGISVANGDYLVLRFFSTEGQNNQNGPAIAFDKISVTAAGGLYASYEAEEVVDEIPERSSSGLVAAFLALCWVMLRRRG